MGSEMCIRDRYRRQLKHVWNKKFECQPLEAEGMTVGIIGAGAIGCEVARLSKALGMTVLGVKRRVTSLEYFDEVYSNDDLDKVLPLCDFVVIVTPLTDATRHMFNMDKFRIMKKTAVVINIARGPVVKEVYINTWNAWGASAQTMPGNEVLTALQQGTIDACDNVNNVCIADGYQQYAKYISVMEYATHFNGITMNEKKFESLTPELQDVITKAAKKAALDCTKNLETKNAEQLEEMVTGGAEKTDNVDKAAFKEAAQSVYDKFLSNNEQGAKYYEAITALAAK